MRRMLVGATLVVVGLTACSGNKTGPMPSHTTSMSTAVSSPAPDPHEWKHIE